MRSFVLVLLGCSSTPSHVVIHWGGANHFTSERLDVGADGDGLFEVTGSSSVRKSFHVAPEQMRALHDLLRDQHVCALRPDPAYQPVPDESETFLELRFPDLACKVVLWDDEWSKRTDSVEIDRAIRALKP